MGGGKQFSLPISGLFLLVATLSGCGANGTVTYKGFPQQNKGLSAAAENGVLKTIQASIVAPNDHCTHGGVKLVSTSSTSDAPVYICNEETKRIYEVTSTNVSALPSTGSLSVCSASGGEGCLASSGFKAVASSELDATKIAAGTIIAGVTGTATLRPADCTVDGATNCVAVAGFTAANTTGLAPKIIAGNTVAGIPGAYTPPGILDVKNGVQFGVTGSLLTGTYPSAGNLLTGADGTADLATFAGTAGGTQYEWFTPAGARLSDTVLANATVTPDATAQTLNAGLYRSVTVSGDADLVAANIVSGVNIFSVPGSASARPADCGTDGGTNCVAIAAFPAADVSNRNGAIVEWSIVQGVSLAGKQGKAYVGSLLSSGAHRDQTASQITYATEAVTGLGAGYRAVPDILRDDDGYTASANAVLKLTRPTAGTWQLGPTAAGTRKVCGKSPTPNTIAGRISDCASQNPAVASWNGAVNGIAGEGVWRLVSVYSASAGLTNGSTCDATCYEVWRDERTGLLWSDRLGESGTSPTTTINWCRAAGNMQLGASTGVDLDNPGNAGNQDCGNAAFVQTRTNFAYSESWCAEVGGLTTPTGVTNGTTFEFDSAKGGMRWTTTPAVKWRLPTKYDFDVAEHNGIRHVLPNMATPTAFWSASVYSSYRDYAWQFSGSYSDVNGGLRSSTSGVRCVGGE
jgi:hypothetical protein